MWPLNVGIFLYSKFPNKAYVLFIQYQTQTTTKAGSQGL